MMAAGILFGFDDHSSMIHMRYECSSCLQGSLGESKRIEITPLEPEQCSHLRREAPVSLTFVSVGHASLIH